MKEYKYVNTSKLGVPYFLETAISSSEVDSLKTVSKYAEDYLSKNRFILNERGFDCPAAKIITTENNGLYSLHIFDHEHGFVPDSSDQEPIIYMPEDKNQPAQPQRSVAELPEPA